MPVLPAWITEPPWGQFRALLPERADTHPLGCHRPRMPGRKQGTKRSVRAAASGGPLGAVTAGANRRDDGLLAATLDSLDGLGPLPDQPPTVHLTPATTPVTALLGQGTSTPARGTIWA